MEGVLHYSFMISIFLFFKFLGTSIVMLFEGAKSSKSPNSLKAKKIIATGAASGSYMALSTIIIFYNLNYDRPHTCEYLLPWYFSCDFLAPNLIVSIWQHIFKVRSLMSHDEEMKSALFLQMSMVNHAIGLFARSFDGHLIDCPGSLVTTSFVVSQLVCFYRSVICIVFFCILFII